MDEEWRANLWFYMMISRAIEEIREYLADLSTYVIDKVLTYEEQAWTVLSDHAALTAANINASVSDCYEFSYDPVQECPLVIMVGYTPEFKSRFM